MENVGKKKLIYIPLNSMSNQFNESVNAHICKTKENDYAMPMLLREDILVDEYKKFLSKSSETVKNKIKETRIKARVEEIMAEEAEAAKLQEDAMRAAEMSPTHVSEFNTTPTSLVPEAEHVQERIEGFDSETEMHDSSDMASTSIGTEMYHETVEGNVNITSGHLQEEEISTKKTSGQKYLRKTMYPFYSHHFNMVRLPKQANKLGAMFTGGWHHSVQEESKVTTSENQNAPDLQGYSLSALSKSDALDVLDSATKAGWFISAINSVSLFPPVKERPDPFNAEAKLQIYDDRQFICAIQPTSTFNDPWGSIYVDTHAPMVTSTTPSKVEEGEESPLVIDADLLVRGNENTNIHHADSIINLYFKGDMQYDENKNSSPKDRKIKTLKGVKMYMAYIGKDTNTTRAKLTKDEFINPATDNPDIGASATLVDESSPYYGKAHKIHVGVIPFDYDNVKDKNGEYTNHVNYSDLTKISFEVATVELHPF